MNFISPKIVNGIKFLLVGNNIWVYFPETGRVRRLTSRAKKQKMMGSDFTYEDMEFYNLKEKFLPSDLKEDKNYYYLKLIPKSNSNLSYDKLTLKIDKETFIPLKIDFYKNGNNSPYKTLLQQNIKIVDDIATPMKTIILDNETGSKSSFEIDTINYNIKIEPGTFNPSNLQEN
ncbi:MAG: outer membrane lipoprotein-sorting protein [Proteobacteria bacterium]|nr:outer membrane lipoprotein-sorting protein [Pseudomonadota bacterium]